MKVLFSKGSFFVFATALLWLAGCAKQDLEADFRPLQMHWKHAEDLDDSQVDSLMPRRDNCMILLTGRLMGESPVQASTVGELNYEVSYKRDPQKPEILVFDGKCADLSTVDRPECRWTATCDDALKIVVKFDNGD